MHVNWEEFSEQLNHLHEKADALGVSYSMGYSMTARTWTLRIESMVPAYRTIKESPEPFAVIYGAMKHLDDALKGGPTKPSIVFG